MEVVPLNMKLSILVKFSVTLICVSFAQSKSCNESCPLNEVFSSNATQCQGTCFTRNFMHLLFKCKTSRGCVCMEGFVRDQDTYKCIPMTSCKAKPSNESCGLNEYYSKSEAGCPQTCQTKDRQYKCKSVSGCVCKKGFVRSDINFQCIPVKLCDKCPIGYYYSPVEGNCVLDCLFDSCSDPNAFVTNCGSGCEPSCHNTTQYCTKDCKFGCFCKNGFIRDELTRKCVLRKNCTTCSDNETAKWGNPLCDSTCQSLDEKCTKEPLIPEFKCYCNEGFVRAIEGSQCVDANQCPILNAKNPQ